MPAIKREKEKITRGQYIQRIADRVRQDHPFGAMIEDVELMISTDKDRVPEYIKSLWSDTFETRSFPREGGALNDLLLAIGYTRERKRLIDQGGIPSTKFEQNYEAAITFDPDGFTELSRSLYNASQLGKLAKIYIKGDGKMAPATRRQAVRRTSTTSTNNRRTASSASRSSNQKTVARRAKGLGATTLACEYLIQEKYTDEEIFRMVMKRLPKASFKKDYISRQRSDINAGRKPKFKMKHHLDRLVKEGGKLIPYSKSNMAREATANRSANLKKARAAKKTATRKPASRSKKKVATKKKKR